MTLPTEDQIEAARTKVRNMLHAADHGNHDGEVAVLRMAASGELLAALKDALDVLDIADAYGLYQRDSLGDLDVKDSRDQARTALSLAQPYEAEVETADE